MSHFTVSNASTIGQGARCLVVDDFEAMRKVTINQLRQMGVERIESARNGAEGLVQALIEDDSVGRRQVEQLRLMGESVMQVLNMINLSSELYKIESGRFVLHAQPVRIGELLRRIAEMNRVTFAEKGLSIAVESACRKCQRGMGWCG